MSRNTIGTAAMGVGFIIAVIAALADQIGLGDEGDFGWKQILGVVVGAVIVVGGFLANRSAGGDDAG